MILVDSSVWIDYFRGTATAQTGLLEGLLDSQELGIGDLNFIEILQGCRIEKEFNEVRRLLGITVRGTIDVAIATRCIVSGYRLLHSNRDFDAFEKHLGLRCAFPDA